MSLKKNKAFSAMRFIVIAFCMVIMVAFCGVKGAWAAVEKPIVKNVSGQAIVDNGETFIDSAFDVFIEPVEGVEYYYSFAPLGEPVALAYYAGVTGNPIGSYFDGSLKNGAFALAIEQSGAFRLPVGEDLKITVSMPAINEEVTLYIRAFANGEVSPAFVHTFHTKLDSSVTLTDGSGNPLLNGGHTQTENELDIYLNGQSGVKYFYTFDTDVSSVSVYYDGVDSNPTGSVFDGALLNGAFVTTITTGGSPVESDGKITIPAPSQYGTQQLKITALVNGNHTVVFEHIFKWGNSFTASFSSSPSAEFINNSDEVCSGSIILAVYKGDQLVVTDTEPFSVDAKGSVKINWSIDLSKYPAGDYHYAAFCWDVNYAPLSSAVRN